MFLKTSTVCKVTLFRLIQATALLGVSQAGAASQNLADFDQIVMAKGASGTLQQSAEDLQYHLQKATGRSLPIVAEDTGAGLAFLFQLEGEVPKETWALQSNDQGICLRGDAQGVGHAVSVFLEKYCGVRWLWPGASGEVIPVCPQLVLPPIKEGGTPEFKRRLLKFGYARFWAELKPELARWVRRTRQGDQLKANFGHAWSHMIPKETYFSAHPDWFALVGGKRNPAQLCESQPELRDEFFKNLLQAADTSGLDIVSVSANDGYGFCECPLCQAKGTTGDAYWDFVNDMALRMKKERPNKGIGTFAYTVGRQPPSKIPTLPDNVYLSMTTYATMLLSEKGAQEYRDFVRSWKTKGVKIIMREYWGTHYWMDLPFLYPEEIATTITEARKAGMIGAYGETGKNFSNMALNYYVVTHLLWDPDRQVGDLEKEFYSAFGVAADPVRRYHEVFLQATRESWRKLDIDGRYVVILNAIPKMFSPEQLTRAGHCLDEAQKAAGTDLELQKRISFLRVGCEYTSLMSELLGLYAKLGRTGFPMEAFEWEATARAPRKVTAVPDFDVSRDFFEKLQQQTFPYTLAEKDEWLLRAWDLGQKRIEMLNTQKSTFALDEGLLAITIEYGMRQWHATIGDFLGKSPQESAVLQYTPPAKKKKP